MKKNIVLFLMMLMIIVPAYSQDPGDPGKKPGIETDRQRASYAMGYRMGLKLQALVKENDVDLDAAMEGVRDAALEAQPQIPRKEMVEIYRQFQNQLNKRQEERQKILAYKNKTEGERFLKENAAKEGIIVTKSGLQYKVLKEGTGPFPKETDIAVVHYRGTLINGIEVFNTYKRGNPVKLPLKRALPFWDEGLRLMKVGAKFRFFIPPDLAYKNFGKPPLIGANVVLIYEAELVGME